MVFEKQKFLPEHLGNNPGWVSDGGTVSLDDKLLLWISSVQFSRSPVSDSLWPHGLQHARPPCLLPTWVSDAIEPSHPLSSLSPPSPPSSPSIFPSTRVFPNESVLCIKQPKYWSFSFSISPSNEYSGLISFRTDCLDLLAVLQINCTPWKKNLMCENTKKEKWQ